MTKKNGLKYSKNGKPSTLPRSKYNKNKQNIAAFYMIWKKYNEIHLRKSKMNLNNRKMTNHPPSPVKTSPVTCVEVGSFESNHGERVWQKLFIPESVVKPSSWRICGCKWQRNLWFIRYTSVSRGKNQRGQIAHAIYVQLDRSLMTSPTLSRDETSQYEHSHRTPLHIYVYVLATITINYK